MSPAFPVIAFTAYCLRPMWHRRSSSAVARNTTLVAFASQTGFAQQLATQTAQSLHSAGRAVQVASFAELSADDLTNVEQALFIVSTTGEGDAPDPAAAFVRKALDRELPLSRLRYGLLALGDREYDNFCAFGHRLDRWLQHQGARTMFDVVEVDNGDDGALRHWQHNLALAFEVPDLPDWETPTYERWTLAERRLVNPGSAGDPCFHLELQPTGGVALAWSAGDIAEIDPFNSHANGGEHHPHREYSIASIPGDGSLHLLVRQMRRPGGELGLGSGWLTQAAPPQSEVSLRIRSNPNFHLPTGDAPLILIGNGTGIAGLRALLKARIAHAIGATGSCSVNATPQAIASMDPILRPGRPQVSYRSSISSTRAISPHVVTCNIASPNVSSSCADGSTQARTFTCAAASRAWRRRARDAHRSARQRCGRSAHDRRKVQERRLLIAA